MKPLEYPSYVSPNEISLTQRNVFAKRFLDLFIASTASVLGIPIILTSAALIKLKSPGPAFFAHERVGYQGKKIYVWKLRTMHINAQELLEKHLEQCPAARTEWNTYFKLKNDPRIIYGIGHFLRQSSMDELPQLWNIFKGEMSIVGPRPFPAYHLKEFPADFQELRKKVVPGLTGLWQISARSNGNLEVQEQLDREYILNNSLLLDMKIIIKTFYVVISQKGAC